MHGFEYQVAVHMIQEGMIEEGLRWYAASGIGMTEKNVIHGMRSSAAQTMRGLWLLFPCCLLFLV